MKFHLNHDLANKTITIPNSLSDSCDFAVRNRMGTLEIRRISWHQW